MVKWRTEAIQRSEACHARTGTTGAYYRRHMQPPPPPLTCCLSGWFCQVALAINSLFFLCIFYLFRYLVNVLVLVSPCALQFIYLLPGNFYFIFLCGNRAVRFHRGFFIRARTIPYTVPINRLLRLPVRPQAVFTILSGYQSYLILCHAIPSTIEQLGPWGRWSIAPETIDLWNADAMVPTSSIKAT